MENNSDITISVYQGPLSTCHCIICPSCGAHELVNCHIPDNTQWRWQIRPFKVDNFSHCLVCDCWFSPDGYVETPTGKGYGLDANQIFKEARELVKQITKGFKYNASFLMKLFVSACRDRGLPMKVWNAEYADLEEDEILARGYKLLE